jgi:hypothetical protein
MTRPGFEPGPPRQEAIEGLYILEETVYERDVFVVIGMKDMGFVS